MPKFTLSTEEKEQLIELNYRKAMLLCRPDKASTKQRKQQAKQISEQVTASYEARDLEKLRTMYNSLKQGKWNHLLNKKPCRNGLDNTWKKVFNEAIGKGRITTIPTSEELKKIWDLQELYCQNNQLTDLSPLAKLTQLQKLYCQNNQITDLSPLAKLTQLQTLWCDNNQITDLLPLANLTQLQTLNCSFNQITDLLPLAKLTQLQELYCSKNRITNLLPLANLTELQKLNCEDNEISERQIRAFKKLHPKCEVSFTIY